jgi:ubiquinone/menaquinone biosynthesis C-methylase UbiE
MGMPVHPSGFTAVDQAGDPEPYVRILDRAAPLWRDIREATHDLLAVRAGDRILEAGCGTGEAARALAHRVGSRGRVVALDRSAAMLAEARRRASGADLPVVYHLGDVYRLPFPDNAFDGCRAERLFQHLVDPAAALAEMCRVTRSGGRLVVAEVDQETRILDSPDRALTRRILNHYGDQNASAWIGRALPRLFRQAGLADIAVTPKTIVGADFALGIWGLDLAGVAERARMAGVISAAEATAWLEGLEGLHRAGHYFTALTSFLVRGTKP